MIIKDAKEFGEKLMSDEDEITIEGNLKDQTLKIKGKGKVTWSIIIGATAVAIVAILTSPATAGFGSVVAMPSLVPVVAILGPKTTYTAVMIGVGGKSVKTLEKLRNYKISENTKNRLTLVRR